MTAGPDPVASIVVPSYRGVDRLPALMDSLAAQQEGTPPFEVIVVVDGVDDGSVALLEAERRLPLRSILLPENRGRVTALNTGFDAARGEVLIRCDDDLLPGPDFVEQHVAAHPPAGAARGVVGLYRNVYTSTPYARAYGERSDVDFRGAAYAVPGSMRWRYWAGNCSLPRRLWEEVGPYDAAYRLYGWEDVDLGYRIAAAGYEVALVPELETTHRVAAVTTSIRARRAAQAAAARQIFERIHGKDVLPPAVPGWSAWNLLVRGASMVCRAMGTARCGAVVDRMLPFLPAPVGRKLVALTVEGAALAGYRRPDLAKDMF